LNINTCKYIFSPVVALCLFSALVSAQEIWYVSGSTVNLRKNPTTDEDNVIAKLKKNDPITVINHRDAWTKCKTEEGLIGWMITSLITKQEPFEITLKNIKKKNTAEVISLKNEHSKLERNFAQLKEKHDKLTYNYNQLNDTYERLKEDRLKNIVFIFTVSFIISCLLLYSILTIIKKLKEKEFERIKKEEKEKKEKEEEQKNIKMEKEKEEKEEELERMKLMEKEKEKKEEEKRKKQMEKEKVIEKIKDIVKKKKIGTDITKKISKESIKLID